jgi:hypothetical protein
MNEMSGSFDFPSGVGTQMMMASASASAPTSLVAVSRPSRTSRLSSSPDTSST